MIYNFVKQCYSLEYIDSTQIFIILLNDINNGNIKDTSLSKILESNELQIQILNLKKNSIDDPNY